MLNPTDQDKRHGATRIEPNADGSFWSAYPNGDKGGSVSGTSSHQALTATLSASGSAGPDLGEAYQLQTGQYSPSRIPLQWCNPNGSETSRSAFLWSHSQFDYVRRVTVVGGSPPYYFYLESPVAGVTFERQAPSWNPYLFLWADLTIDHAQFTSGTKSFTLRCIDQEGSALSLPMTVTVDDSKFVVMADGVGSSVAAGTLADPFENLGDIYGTSDTDATHAGKIIVARQGSYFIDQYDAANAALSMNSNKPSGWIPYPGETISFQSGANVNLSATEDYYFGAATYTGGDTSNSNVKIFAGFGSHARVVFDHQRFVNIAGGSVGNDNEACIFMSNTGYDSHTHISVIDPYFEDLPPSGNGFAMVDYYSTSQSAFVGGTLRDTSTGNGIWLKGKNNTCMFAGIDCYDTAGQDMQKMFYPNQDSAATGAVIQFIGCKGYRSTDGLFGDTMLMLGDNNAAWGTVYADRMTLLGRVNDGGGDASINGDAFVDSCIVINDQSPRISNFVTVTNTVEASRANAGTYVNSSGDVLTGYLDYGTVGANFVAPEV